MDKQSQKADIDDLNEMLALTEATIQNLTLSLAEINPEDKDAIELVIADITEQENIRHSILLNIELVKNSQNEPPAEFGN